MTAAEADSTASSVPAMDTRQGSTAWSIWMRAPVMACSPLITSPWRPMTRPTMFLGHSTTRSVHPGGTATTPGAGPAGVRSRSSSRLRQATMQLAGPVSSTLRGWPSG